MTLLKFKVMNKQKVVMNPIDLKSWVTSTKSLRVGEDVNFELAEMVNQFFRERLLDGNYNDLVNNSIPQKIVPSL